MRLLAGFKLLKQILQMFYEVGNALWEGQTSSNTCKLLADKYKNYFYSYNKPPQYTFKKKYLTLKLSFLELQNMKES